MTEPCDRTATELAAALRAGELSAEELVRSCLGRIDAVEPEVRAFLERTPELALEQARAVDARPSAATIRYSRAWSRPASVAARQAATVRSRSSGWRWATQKSGCSSQRATG